MSSNLRFRAALQVLFFATASFARSDTFSPITEVPGFQSGYAELSGDGRVVVGMTPLPSGFTFAPYRYNRDSKKLVTAIHEFDGNASFSERWP